MKKTDEKHTTTTTTVETVSAPPVPSLSSVLSAEEERVVRMRSGATVPATETLGSKLDGVAEGVRDEVAARLALIEAELLSLQPTVDAARTQRIVDVLKGKDQ